MYTGRIQKYNWFFETNAKLGSHFFYISHSNHFGSIASCLLITLKFVTSDWKQIRLFLLSNYNTFWILNRTWKYFYRFDLSNGVLYSDRFKKRDFRIRIWYFFRIFQIRSCLMLYWSKVWWQGYLVQNTILLLLRKLTLSKHVELKYLISYRFRLGIWFSMHNAMFAFILLLIILYFTVNCLCYYNTTKFKITTTFNITTVFDKTLFKSLRVVILCFLF